MSFLILSRVGSFSVVLSEAMSPLNRIIASPSSSSPPSMASKVAMLSLGGAFRSSHSFPRILLSFIVSGEQVQA